MLLVAQKLKNLKFWQNFFKNGVPYVKFNEKNVGGLRF